LRWAVIVTIVLLVVALVAGEIFLPRIVAKGLEVGLGRALGQGEALEVSLKARPALKLLVGRVDELTVESKQAMAATLAIDSLAVTMEDIALNLRELLGSSKRLTVSYNARIGATIKIGEANLRRHIAENVPGFTDPSVKISPDRVSIAGCLKFAERFFVVSAEGRFVGNGEQRVDFVVDKLSLDSEPLPPGLASAVIAALGGPELFIDLGRFPMPLVLKEVKLLDGWLVIDAQTPVR
jgi:hypothetical protein